MPNMQEQAVETGEQPGSEIDEQPEKRLHPIRKYSGALLDVDGVLADTEDTHYQVRVIFFRQYGIDFTKQMHKDYWIKADGKGIPGFLKDYGLQDKLTLEDVRQEFQRIFLEEIDNLNPGPGAHELIRYLNEIKIPMAAVSSGYKNNVERTLEALGMRFYMKGVVAKEDVENVKPYPELWYKGANIVNKNIRECVVVEDSPKGIVAANRAGAGLVIRCIYKWTNDLDFTGEARSDITVASLADIIDLDLFWLKH